MADLKAMAENLVNLSVKDVNELATILKDEYGIEPAAAAVAVAGPAGGGEAAEEKTEVAKTEVAKTPKKKAAPRVAKYAGKKLASFAFNGGKPQEIS